MNQTVKSGSKKATQVAKWKIEGYDTFEGGPEAYYPLPGTFATEEAAVQAALKRLKELDVSQPTSSSGGQSMTGIQDQVFIVSPEGKRRRIFPAQEK